MVKVLACIAILMEIAAAIMSYPLFCGWHPELVIPFLICFVGGFVIALGMMCTPEYWRAVFGVND